jgi:carboxyl-terminal processing protease
MKRKFFFGAIFVVVVGIIGFGFVEQEDEYFKINKDIDLYGKVFKEVVNNYVDQVDPNKFTEAGIDGMLSTLDPYTVYINDEENDEIDLITRGQYGGVGISIGLRDGYVTVISPMEGYSAQKQGIKAGDKIIAINGEAVDSMGIDSVRDKVRGEPGTEVKLTIQREDVKNPIEFVLVREEIKVHNVTYSGYLHDGIGYIRLEEFSRLAGDEVRQALLDLKSEGNLQGVILDLRDNPGGLLEAAVETVNDFVPKGSVVVTTRGRNGSDEKVYTATDDPIAPDVPLAVLINGNSASASEIVAGAIQDLDRGIIVGTRSFGKGLVQTITQLGYNTSLKMTTARYYTPSGRCIQEIDYAHKNKEGVFLTTPDSLRKEFKTADGRIVLNAGGISPDTVVQSEDHSDLYVELLRQAMFFKFATTYVAHHPSREEFSMSDSLLETFHNYLIAQHFEFKDDAENKLDETEDAVKKEQYSSSVLALLNDAEQQIQKEKTSEFSKHEQEIRQALEEEIIGHYNGDRGRIKASLAYDKDVRVAADILSSKNHYAFILKPER